MIEFHHRSQKMATQKSPGRICKLPRIGRFIFLIAKNILFIRKLTWNLTIVSLERTYYLPSTSMTLGSKCYFSGVYDFMNSLFISEELQSNSPWSWSFSNFALLDLGSVLFCQHTEGRLREKKEQRGGFYSGPTGGGRGEELIYLWSLWSDMGRCIGSGISFPRFVASRKISFEHATIHSCSRNPISAMQWMTFGQKWPVWR